MKVIKTGKKEKWLPFKSVGQIDLIFHVDVLGAYVRMCTRFEVSMVKSVAIHTVHRQRRQLRQDNS